MIYTTLNAIRACSPCNDSWEKLLAGLGKKKADDEPLPFSKIVEINGLEDALWATRAAPEHDKDWRLFAVWCAREASQYSNDWRVIYAIQIAERYAHGPPQGPHGTPQGPHGTPQGPHGTPQGPPQGPHGTPQGPHGTPQGPHGPQGKNKPNSFLNLWDDVKGNENETRS